MSIEIIVQINKDQYLYKPDSTENFSEVIPMMLHDIMNDHGEDNVQGLIIHNSECSYTLDRLMKACCKGIQIARSDIKVIYNGKT